MYQGKHSNNAANRSTSPRRKRRLRWRREFVLLCSILVLVIGVIGGSLAYLATSTQDVTNTFTPPTVDVDINETFTQEESDEKKNVSFTNNSDFPVYMRATYIANWVSNDGSEVYPAQPKLSVSINTNAWTQNGSYWYLNRKVDAKESSPIFINSLKAAEVMDGYHLEVEVIVETIQAEPSNAIQEAWGVAAPDAG